MAYTPCLAPHTYWEATDRPGQSQTANAWYKQMRQDCENARLALQSVKDKEMVSANRKLETTNLHV